MHMVIPLEYSVSFAVGTIKKNTSRALREKCWFLDKVYWRSRRQLVNRVLCVYGGNMEEIISRYVAWQRIEDADKRQLEF